MSLYAPRAFSDNRFDYYELQVDLGGIVPKGAIFIHDTEDNTLGSISQGCLKLCWTPEGDTYNSLNAGLCAGTVVFHACFKDSDMFKLVKSVKDNDNSNKLSEILNEIKEIADRLSELTGIVYRIKGDYR